MFEIDTASNSDKVAKCDFDDEQAYHQRGDLKNSSSEQNGSQLGTNWILEKQTPRFDTPMFN